MDDAELRRVTRETAEMLFGPPKPGESVFQLWKKFDPDLARHISTFFTGRLYARNVISQKERELCAVARANGATAARRTPHPHWRSHERGRHPGGGRRGYFPDDDVRRRANHGGRAEVCKAVLQERGMWDDD